MAEADQVTPLRIAIAIPNEGTTRPEAYDNHLYWAIHLGMIAERSKQEQWAEQYEFYWFTAGRILTPFAREQLVNRALDGGMDYILMLDDDMIINDVEIFECLIKHKVDVVAPLAFTRNAPHYPVLYRSNEGTDPISKERYYQMQYIKNYPKDKLVECDAVGFGMVLINLSIVKKMQAPYFMSTTGSGEDIYFCIKAREAGAHIFMDTSLKLGHIGAPKIVTEESFEQANDIAAYRKIYGEYTRGEYYVDSSNTGKPIGVADD